MKNFRHAIRYICIGMKTLRNLLFLLTLTVFSLTSYCQEDKDWRLFPGGSNIHEKDSVINSTENVDSLRNNEKVIRSFDLDFSQSEGQVKIIGDERFSQITEKMKEPEPGKSTPTMKGYRIQAFFDPDQSKVKQKRAEYLARNNDQPAYIDFLAPNFRLRIGDFRTKLDARKFQESIKDIFPDAIIVTEEIELPVLPE